MRAGPAAVILWCAIAAPCGSSASSAVEAAERAADALRSAGAVLEAAEGADDRITALTETVRAYEAGLAVFRQALRDAALRESALRGKLDAGNDRLGRLLGALQAIEHAPDATTFLHPAGVLGTARASALMADAVPSLARDAADLRADLEELRILILLREDAFATLAEGLEGAQSARSDLARAVQERRRDEIAPTDLAAIQALVRGAETLDAFASVLGVDGPESAGGPAFEAEMGRLRPPVSGRVLTAFNETDAAGVKRPGVTLATEARAVVAAPWPSTVRFAGPFSDYGNVIVLEPEAGYLVILAGLGDVFVGTGQVVRADEPIGLMGGQPPDPGGILTATAGGDIRERPETLYIELRSANEPQDPADWFELGKE